jgi:hypothetical protein
MSKPLSPLAVEQITNILTCGGNSWEDLIAHCTAVQSALSQPAPAPKSDVDAAWVKASAEAILKANIRLTTNAQSFVAQTFARASQYPTVKFSPKQWEWFNKLMLDAGIEASEVPS